MNFFAAQEEARKASRKLVWWFGLCVLGVVSLLYCLFIILGKLAGPSQDTGMDVNLQGQELHLEPIGFWEPGIFLATFVGVGGLILIGSLFKLARLSGGGAVVASDLGGRLVDPDTREPLERRLLNVVEEMAIASGIPVPDVWIMDAEQGINAFAAGTDPSNAVIGVTRGTLEQLGRAELQGVIAHEYSHILNGDMKLNMRLTGWIFGLVMISILGRLMLQSLRFMRGSRNSKGGGVILAIVLIGVAVWLIGSIGVLFARMIQAAISRQREFLADASAVQFTRYPDGIAGALKKIGGYATHGQVQCAKATETRHMFFASSNLSSVLATHPPLEERIKAIDPAWEGQMLQGGSNPVAAEEFKGAMGFSGASPFASATEAAAAVAADGSHGQDNATARQQTAAESSTQATPGMIQAKGGLLGLLLKPSEKEQARSLMQQHSVESETIEHALLVCEHAHDSTAADKLSLVDASLPYLRRMSVDEASQYLAAVESLIAMDGQIDLFEFMLQQVCQRHIEMGIGIRQPSPIRHKFLHALDCEVAQVLAIFAAIANDDQALAPAKAEFLEHTGRDLTTPEMDFAAASEALKKMDAATPIVKRQILRLCWLTVHQDGKVNDSEAEMLRAVAEALGCALPRQGDAFADLN